jgi:hypothetical protein
MAMARRALTVELDASLVDVITRTAADDGVAPDELVGEALRRYFGLRGLAILEDVAQAQAAAVLRQGEDEVMALAVEEVRAYRAARRASG